jgi:hypothetical protein
MKQPPPSSTICTIGSIGTFVNIRFFFSSWHWHWLNASEVKRRNGSGALVWACFCLSRPDERRHAPPGTGPRWSLL